MLYKVAVAVADSDFVAIVAVVPAVVHVAVNSVVIMIVAVEDLVVTMIVVVEDLVVIVIVVVGDFVVETEEEAEAVSKVDRNPISDVCQMMKTYEIHMDQRILLFST